MLPKPRRPREKRILPLTRVTYSIEEFCATSGLSRAEVECAIADGSLRIIKVGNRRLILAPLTAPAGNFASKPSSPE